MIHRRNGAELLVIIKTLCNKVSEIMEEQISLAVEIKLHLQPLASKPTFYFALREQGEPVCSSFITTARKRYHFFLQVEDGNIMGKCTKNLQWIKTTSQLRIPDRNSRDHLGTPPRYLMKGRDKRKLCLTFIVHELSYSVWHIQIGSDG